MMFTLTPSIWRSLFVLALIAITTLALMPKPPSLGALGSDKTHHLAAFGVLALLAHGAWPRLRWLSLWAGLLAYGVFIELAQSLTPNRYAEALDVLADALGIGLGQALTKLWSWIRQGRQQAR